MVSYLKKEMNKNYIGNPALQYFICSWSHSVKMAIWKYQPWRGHQGHSIFTLFFLKELLFYLTLCRPKKEFLGILCNKIHPRSYTQTGDFL